MESLEEKYKEFLELLGEYVHKYNFKNKRKGYYQRKIGECIQYIQITSTKTRQKDEIHIMPIVGFEYVKLDKVIAFLKNRHYEKGFGTGSLTFSCLRDDNKTYAFYIDGNTDIFPIVSVIVDNIEKYALDYLDSCSTLKKYENMLLTEKEKMTYSAVMKYEWNLLAVSLVLQRNNYNRIMEDYKTDLSKDRIAFNNVQERIQQLIDVKMEV